MPIENKTTRTRTTNVLTYTCSVCAESFGNFESCGKHEWKEHFQAESRTHTECGYTDTDFRHFPSEQHFDAFVSSKCNPKPKFDDDGWYRVYEYEDYCRGCHMGTAIGLEKIDDEDTDDWCTEGDHATASRVELEFGLPPECPATFTVNGCKYRRRSVYVQRLSVSITYASTEDAQATVEQVVASWKVWRERGYGPSEYWVAPETKELVSS